MDKKAFGKQLQLYRERAGYSQEALAEQIECSTIFISYIERGEKSPSLDTLVKLANALDISVDILFGKELKNYIITITRNYCKNYLRNTNRHPEDFLDEIPEPQTDEDGILDYLITKDRNNRLIEEVNKLDDIYKSVLELKYINEFSNDEIASFMKIKKKTVEMRLYRANLILRERLKEQGDV